MSAKSTPILVLGRAADADVLLRAIESGAVKKIWPVGILSPSPADRGQTMRGVAVLGGSRRSRTRRRRLRRRAAAGRAAGADADRRWSPRCMPETILMKAKRLGLVTSRLPSLDEGGEALRLAPVNVEDLLVRPGVKIDYQRLEACVRGKADHRHRRRRLDRLGNLRSHRHLRRRRACW